MGNTPNFKRVFNWVVVESDDDRRSAVITGGCVLYSIVRMYDRQGRGVLCFGACMVFFRHVWPLICSGDTGVAVLSILEIF